MKRFQVGVFHLEDNAVIISHTQAIIKHALDEEGVSVIYRSGQLVLEVTEQLSKLREECDQVILISDRNLGAEINGDVAIKAIARYYQQVPLVIYSATGSDEEILGIVSLAKDLRGDDSSPVIYCEKRGNGIGKCVLGIIREQQG